MSVKVSLRVPISLCGSSFNVFGKNIFGQMSVFGDGHIGAANARLPWVQRRQTRADRSCPVLRCQSGDKAFQRRNALGRLQCHQVIARAIDSGDELAGLFRSVESRDFPIVGAAGVGDHVRVVDDVSCTAATGPGVAECGRSDVDVVAVAVASVA